MAMVCPRCSGNFEQRLVCPACRVRLTYEPGQKTTGTRDGPTVRWQQGPWGRIVLGTLLALGIGHGLRQLCTAGLLATGDESAPDVWSTLYGLIALQGLHALGLLIGGGLAGAGQRRGALLGAVVGLCSGLTSIALYSRDAGSLLAVILCGQAVLQTGFGALGGFLGRVIWKPSPTLLPLAPAGNAERVILPRPTVSFFAGPIAWGRVFCGAAIVVCGTLWANVILHWALEASDGKLTISSHLQAQLVTWEITALAMLAGSTLAGATTRNCMKQGLCVGLLASAVLVSIRMWGKPQPPAMLLLTIISAHCLGVAGAWFGGHLFPPIFRVHRPKRLGPTFY